MSIIKRPDLSKRIAAVARLAGPWGAAALAAQAGGDSTTTPRASETIDTVIVTATKREENIQDVPVAISAFSEEVLAERNVQEARDLNAPNFLFPQMYTTSRSYISVRGIFQEVNNIGFDGGFSAYLDGVYLGRNMAYDIDMAGVERVEILRGPQGTLFGKNTIGGLMNVVSKRPSQEFEGNVQAEVGNFNLTRLRGSVNLPLADDLLAARISVQKVDRDGYVKNLTGGPEGGSIDLLSSRAQILFTPLERLEVSLSLDYLESDNIGYTSEVIASESTVPALGDDKPFTYHPNQVPVERKWDKGAALTAQYEFDNGHTLTSISGARRTRTSWVLDGDATALDFYTENLNDQQDLLSQELRLASPSGGKLDYVLGLYYYDEDADATDPIPFTALYPGGPFLVYYNTRVNTEDYAAFAHLDWHLTDALTLYGGVRYTDETKQLESERRVLPATYVIPPGFVPGLTTDGTGVPPQVTSQIDSEEVTWEAGVKYAFSDATMAYAEVSTGFKSGGFNIRDGATVEPEHLTAYEIGAKTTLLEGRMTFNVAAFYNDYEDLQVRSLDLTTVPITVVLHNAASVVAKGLEAEIEAIPVDNLTLHLGVGYVDSTYEDFKNVPARTGGTIDASGNELPMTPPWTINGGLRYIKPLGTGAVVLNADANYIADRWSTLDAGQNSPTFALPSYTTVNARLGYQAANERWEVFLWGKNLADERALVDYRLTPILGASATYPNTLTLQYGTYLEPRTYGVSFAVNF